MQNILTILWFNFQNHIFFRNKISGYIVKNEKESLKSSYFS